MNNHSASGNGTQRIGVYVCHCGTNIAKTVDVVKVAETMEEAPGVVVSRHYRFMCSDPGQELIQKDIKELKLDRVVVAACSPLMHEATFRKAVEDAGMNRYFFEMTNIREQVSWVTIDPRMATNKALVLLRGAVARVKFHHPLEMRKVPICQRVMIVGGGIAGIETALRIANAGFEVVLVEKEPSIGGHMSKFDKTFPTLDCAACILTPKMVSVGKHPRIKLLTYSKVEEVNGYIGNFKVRVRRKARYVDPTLCNSCGSCYEACPSQPYPKARRLLLGKQIIREGKALEIRHPSIIGPDHSMIGFTNMQPLPKPEPVPVKGATK